MNAQFSTEALKALDKAEAEAERIRRQLKADEHPTKSLADGYGSADMLDSRERDRLRKRLAKLEADAEAQLMAYWGWLDPRPGPGAGGEQGVARG